VYCTSKQCTFNFSWNWQTVVARIAEVIGKQKTGFVEKKNAS